MLRIRTFASASDAKRYFNESLSPGDYYTRGQELGGEWYGRGSQRLGLTGPVDKEAFHRLCDNMHPSTGERLTLRNREGRRVAYDIGFSVPKSVSTLFELTGDDRILEAFRQSVRETLRDHMEPEMQTRVRKNGAFENRSTGELVWAEFIHRTGRPVDGVPDPQLHCHVFAFNATFDPVEKVWKAGEFGAIKSDAPYFEAIQQSILGSKLADLGYAIRHKAKGWEVEGVPSKVIEAFSRRTQQIEAIAEQLGVTDPARKAELGAQTRAKKAPHMSMRELRSSWEERLSAADRAALWQTYERSRSAPPPAHAISAEQALTFALDDLLSKNSVIQERRLLSTALKFGVGSVSVDALKSTLRRAVDEGRVLRREHDGRGLVTTPQVRDEELRMLSFAREGRGTCDPIKSRPHRFVDEKLNADQRGAVSHVLTSTDQVMAIRGAAGVGKTRLMQETAKAIKESGKQIYAFAPWSQASRGTLREDGFRNAETVALLLENTTLQNRLKNQVMWIDEAGTLGVRDMAKVLEIARKQNARVILTGDTKQHGPVDRGDALRLLEDHAGIKPVTVTTIVRQQVRQYREAVEHLAKGELAAAVDRLDSLDAIKVVDNATRHQEVAKAFVDAVNSKNDPLVVSPTHAEGRKATHAIREALKEEGLVDRNERDVSTLVPLRMNDAEKSQPRFYERGLIIQMHRTVKGFHPGERMEVLGEHVSGKGLHVRSTINGREKILPLAQAPNFEVYRKETRSFAVGDKIRFTRGHRTFDNHRVDNGTMRSIKAFDNEGRIVLDNGWVLGKEHGHLTHGYVVTSHAAQSKTVNHVIIAQGAESFAASDMKQFYVSVSRGVFKVDLFTDDRKALMEAVDHARDAMSVTEFMQLGLEQTAQRHYQFKLETERAARFEATRRQSGRDPSEKHHDRSFNHEQERPGPEREMDHER